MALDLDLLSGSINAGVIVDKSRAFLNYGKPTLVVLNKENKKGLFYLKRSHHLKEDPKETYFSGISFGLYILGGILPIPYISQEKKSVKMSEIDGIKNTLLYGFRAKDKEELNQTNQPNKK